MKKIIIFGIGQIAELTYDLVQQIQNLEVVAFTANKENINSETFLKLPIYAIEEIKKKLNCNDYYFVTAISYKNVNENRENIYKEMKKEELEPRLEVFGWQNLQIFLR